LIGTDSHVTISDVALRRHDEKGACQNVHWATSLFDLDFRWDFHWA